MARPVVGNPFDNQIPTVAPTATPVDTFVRGIEKRSSMKSLADTLTRFSQKSAPILQRLETEAAEREILEGQRLYQENRIAMGDAVRQGIIEEGASPYLRKGYRISQMNTLAARYATELEAKLTTEKLYTNGDPEALETYIGNFQKEFLENNGLTDFAQSELAEHFGLSAAKAEEAMRASWTSKHIEWQKEENYRQFQEEVATYVTSIIQPDMTDEQEDIAKAKLANWLQEQAKLRRVDGQENKRVADSIVSGILFAAEQSKDPEVLDILLSTKLGTDVIGKSVDNLKKVYDTKVTIARLLEADATAQREELKRENDALAGEVSSAVFASVHSSQFDQAYVNTQIARLTATQDLKLANEARVLMNYVNTVNERENKALFTPDLFAEADSMMALQPDRAAAMEAALEFVKQNDLGRPDLEKLMTNWTQYYAPDGNEFGLKFNVTSSDEGAALADMKKAILGSEYAADYEDANKQKAYMIVRFDFIDRLETFVEGYQKTNEVDEVPARVLRRQIYVLQNDLMTKYYEQGFVSENPAIRELGESFPQVQPPTAN